MKIWRAFLIVATSLLCLTSHALAMGSGPHRLPPLGVPLPRAHSVPDVSQPSPIWIGVAAVLIAVFVLTALMTFAETRRR